jgi:hypothetical protein
MPKNKALVTDELVFWYLVHWFYGFLILSFGFWASFGIPACRRAGEL